MKTYNMISANGLCGSLHKIRKYPWVNSSFSCFKHVYYQKWSPLMTEITTLYGISFRHYSLSVSTTRCHFLDNELPTVTPGEF